MNALALATLRDLARRPSIRLTVLAAAALVAVLPLLGAPGASMRDQTRLTLELGAASICGVTQALAGVLATHAAQGASDRGRSAELVAAPIDALHFMAGRLTGVLLLAVCALAAMTTAAIGVWPVIGIPLAELRPMAPCIVAAVPGAAAAAALGLAAGRTLRAELAVIAALSLPWLAALLGPIHAPASIIAIASGIFPAPAGPLNARQYALGQPIDGTVAMLRIVGSALQSVGWMIVAATPLIRELRTSRETS